jgi:surface protein
MKKFIKNISVLLAVIFTMSFNANSQEIGDVYEGGYIFQINEDGTGLVADIQDLGQISWNDAMDIAASATSQGYEDWYLPSIQELALMYSTIGNGGPDGNIGDFMYNWYWSSTEGSPESEPLHWLPYSETAWGVDFASGTESPGGKAGGTLTVRVIRAVTFETEVLGCMDATAFNYNAEANTHDGSCIQAITQENIHSAVDLWISDQASAESTYGNISDWDVSSVTNMEGMFNSANSFNGDLSSWDVSNVTNMEDMFRDADAFSQDLSSWDVSSVINMEMMFVGSNPINIGEWDVSNVTNMSHMFWDPYSNHTFDQDL